jgi:hypothetical protein
MVRSSDASRTFQPDNQATRYALLINISIHSLSGMATMSLFCLVDHGITRIESRHLGNLCWIGD